MQKPDLEPVKDQLRNIQVSKHNEEKILISSKKKLKPIEDDFGVTSIFSDRQEKRISKMLLTKYLDDYTIETIADKNTLKQLIYFEVIQHRLERITNEAHKENKAVPLKYLDSLHKNSNQIINLKQTLGITHEKDGKGDLYSDLDNVMKKFANWRKENIAERTLFVDGKPVLLKMRTDKYDASKHPFFKGRFLTSPTLLKLYKDTKDLLNWVKIHNNITISIENEELFLVSDKDKFKLPLLSKKNLAEALEVTEDYIDWYEDKIEKKS